MLVICPQDQYRYLSSNIHIGPRIQIPVSAQWCQTLYRYVKVQGKMVYIKICIKSYFNQINTFQDIGINLKRNNWLKCIRRVE